MSLHNLKNNNFEEGFIGWLDILGFKDHITKCESGDKTAKEQLDKIINFVSMLKDANNFAKTFPASLPVNKSQSILHELIKKHDVSISMISDTIVISILSKNNETNTLATISMYMMHFFLSLLELGFLSRGGIAKGKIYIPRDNFIFGTALINAYQEEQKLRDIKSPNGTKASCVGISISKECIYHVLAANNFYSFYQNEVFLNIFNSFYVPITINGGQHCMVDNRHLGISEEDRKYAIQEYYSRIDGIIERKIKELNSDDKLDSEDKENILKKWNWFYSFFNSRLVLENSRIRNASR